MIASSVVQQSYTTELTNYPTITQKVHIVLLSIPSLLLLLPPPAAAGPRWAKGATSEEWFSYLPPDPDPPPTPGT